MYLENTITIFKTTKAKFTTLTLTLLLVFTKAEKKYRKLFFLSNKNNRRKVAILEAMGLGCV